MLSKRMARPLARRHRQEGAPPAVVFTTTSEGIATITGFPGPDLSERFGLPPHTD